MKGKNVAAEIFPSQRSDTTFVVYTSLSRKDLDYADKEVKRALAAEEPSKKVVTLRGKYNSYTPDKSADRQVCSGEWQ